MSQVPAFPTNECPLCACGDIQPYLRGAAGEVLRCGNCRLVFLSPTDDSDGLYSRDYFDERAEYFFADGVSDGSGDHKPHVHDFLGGIEWIETRTAPPGRLLDVGCATGTFLALARDRGWECRGVELSAFASEFARSRHGLVVFTGRLEEAAYPDEHFNVVTMWDVIEHLPAPAETLCEVRRILRPDGVLLLNTPNERSLIKGLARMTYRASFGRRTAEVDRLYHAFHLFYFDDSTLTRLCEACGIDVIERHRKIIPTSKGRGSSWVKTGVGLLSLAERVLHREFELLYLARKAEAVSPVAMRPAASNSD